jgi:hypothetical protein
MASKTDAVCLALTALWQADPDLDSVQVVDGPQANSDASDEWLFVGFDGDAPDEGNEAVAAEQDWMAFAKTKQETAEVTCAVVVRRGDTDTPAARASAYAILSDAEDSLRADLTLSGSVMNSYISAHQYIPVITQGGCKARVVFTVTYQAQL